MKLLVVISFCLGVANAQGFFPYHFSPHSRPPFGGFPPHPGFHGQLPVGTQSADGEAGDGQDDSTQTRPFFPPVPAIPPQNFGCENPCGQREHFEVMPAKCEDLPPKRSVGPPEPPKLPCQDGEEVRKKLTFYNNKNYFPSNQSDNNLVSHISLQSVEKEACGICFGFGQAPKKNPFTVTITCDTENKIPTEFTCA